MTCHRGGVAHPADSIVRVIKDGTRSEVTYRQFVDQCSRWLPFHPEAFVMADGCLHRATCAEIGNLVDLSWLVGVDKTPDMLILHAMLHWEGYLRCPRCLVHDRGKAPKGRVRDGNERWSA